MIDIIIRDAIQTIYMVFSSSLLTVFFGLPLGVFLCISREDSILPMPFVNRILGVVVNVFRSFPFIILIIILLPISRYLAGTSVGSTVAIIPLTVSAVPFIARLFEGALNEVDKGLIEATKSMGASNFTIVKVMVLEALPSLINSITVTMVSLVGYSTMAGAVGAGGIGDLALRVGYQTYRPDILFYSVVIIIIMVQLIQVTGDFVVKFSKRHR